MIKAKDPVREAFSGCSTGNKPNNYFGSKASAINTFETVLEGCGYSLSLEAWVDYNGDAGRANHPVCDESGRVVGCAVFSWYRMPSGRYEFIGYLA